MKDFHKYFLQVLTTLQMKKPSPRALHCLAKAAMGSYIESTPPSKPQPEAPGVTMSTSASQGTVPPAPVMGGHTELSYISQLAFFLFSWIPLTLRFLTWGPWMGSEDSVFIFIYALCKGISSFQHILKEVCDPNKEQGSKLLLPTAFWFLIISQRTMCSPGFHLLCHFTII